MMRSWLLNLVPEDRLSEPLLVGWMGRLQDVFQRYRGCQAFDYRS